MVTLSKDNSKATVGPFFNARLQIWDGVEGRNNVRSVAKPSTAASTAALELIQNQGLVNPWKLMIFLRTFEGYITGFGMFILETYAATSWELKIADRGGDVLPRHQRHRDNQRSRKDAGQTEAQDAVDAVLEGNVTLEMGRRSVCFLHSSSLIRGRMLTELLYSFT